MVPVFIHPGFSNTGTTSLQTNFFARRSDIFFAGEPYGDRGGLFTHIRSVEDLAFDGASAESQARNFIFAKAKNRPVVISDETLTEAPQLYFRPFVMPRDVIAMRLKALFPESRIVFTIREQRARVVSMYLNLKRNYAKFSQVVMPPFDAWFGAMISQVRSEYLHNLDYTDTIDLYAALFGEKNILVLPLEVAARHGLRSYLGRLAAFMGIPLSAEDVDRFSVPQNQRMTAVEAAMADLKKPALDTLLSHIADQFGADALEAALKASPPAEQELTKEQVGEIRKRVSAPNKALSARFDLELERYGYL